MTAVKPFAHIVAGDRDFIAFEQIVVFDVLIEHARQRCGKTGDVRSSLPRGDIIDIGVEVFCIGIIPLHRHFKFESAVGDLL